MVKKASQKRTNDGYRVDMDLYRLFESIPEKERMLILGQEDVSQHAPYARDGIKKKNEAIGRFYHAGKGFIKNEDRIGNPTFFFSEKIVSNGRPYHIEPAMFNIQSDKFFARHMVTLATYKKDGYLVKDFEAYFGTIGNAMGIFKGEKINPNKYESMVKEFFDSNPVLKRAAVSMATGKKLTEPQLKAVVEATTSEEGMWTFKAIREYGRYLNNDGKPGFRSSFEGEVDGVTNGIAFMLFQAGEKGKDLYNKVGVFFKGQKEKTLWEYFEDGNFDSYETLMENANKSFDRVNADQELIDIMKRNKIIDRNMAKSPLMVFVYGMNLDAITEDVSIEMAKKIIDGAFQGNKDFVRALEILYGQKNDKLANRLWDGR